MTNNTNDSRRSTPKLTWREFLLGDRVTTFISIVLICIFFHLAYSLISEYQKHGSRIFKLEATRIGENEVRIAELESSLTLAVSKLDTISADATALSHHPPEPSLKSTQLLAKALLEDKDFRSELLASIENAPMKGFLPQGRFNEFVKQNKSALGSFEKQLMKLQPVYDAIDIESRENNLAIPLIRKDILSITDNVDQIESQIKEDRNRIETELALETTRIYDLGKWFLGLLAVACVLPLLERLFKIPKPNPDTANPPAEDAE